MEEVEDEKPSEDNSKENSDTASYIDERAFIDTSNNSKEQDINTNIDDIIQGRINTETSEDNLSQRHTENVSLEHINKSVVVKDLDHNKTANNSSEILNCPALITIDDNDDDNSVEEIADLITIDDDKSVEEKADLITIDDDSSVEEIDAILENDTSHRKDTKGDEGSTAKISGMIDQDSDEYDGDTQDCWANGRWSGSGIWERTENRRWVAVQQHRIPCRSMSESSLEVTDLGTGQFVNRFEFAEPTDHSNNSQQFQIVVSKESMIRLNTNISVPGPSSSPPGPSSSPPSQDEPVPGPSSAPQSGDSNLPDSPESSGVTIRQNPSRNEHSRLNASELWKKLRRTKNKRNRRAVKRRRNRNLQRQSGQSQQQRPPRRKEGGDTPKTRIMLTRSADSSPGRDSPSPTSLLRICLYWEKRLASPEYVIHSDPESEP